MLSIGGDGEAGAAAPRRAGTAPRQGRLHAAAARLSVLLPAADGAVPAVCVCVLQSW